MTIDSDEEAVEAAKVKFRRVFLRSGACPRRLCRRRRVCHTGWTRGSPDNPLYEPTGGCPIMTKAEWEVIQLGVMRKGRLVGRWLKGRTPPKDSPPEGGQRRRSKLSFAEYLWAKLE